MSDQKATQRRKIVNYCDQYGSITVREAFERLDINSPTKRISELKRSGYDVQKRVETKEKANGSVVRYTRYFIKEVGCNA